MDEQKVKASAVTEAEKKENILIKIDIKLCSQKLAQQLDQQIQVNKKNFGY